MSAPYLTIANPNDFAGVTSGINRIATMHAAKRGDAVRTLWIKHILPQATSTAFISSIMNSTDFFKMFTLDVPADFDDSIPWNTFQHVAAYQNLAQLTDKNIPTRLVPWQLRFEFAPQTLSRVLSASLDLHVEIGGLFEKAGWEYWRTETGFCMAPLWLFSELKSLSTVYHAWQNMRDFKGAGFTDFEVEIPDPPALWRSSEVVKKSGALDDMPALESPGPSDFNYHHSDPNYPAGGSNAAAGSAAGRTA
jgi:hypothetical protein